MKNKQQFSLPAVGISSLVAIFAALCLAVFAQLAISTAKTDEKLSDQGHQAIMDYYQAEREADTIIALLQNGQVPEGVTFEDGVYSFQCVISDTQVLEVEVRLEGDTHTILRWQAVSTADWQADEDLPVWDGEN